MHQSGIAAADQIRCGCLARGRPPARRPGHGLWRRPRRHRSAAWSPCATWRLGRSPVRRYRPPGARGKHHQPTDTDRKRVWEAQRPSPTGGSRTLVQ